MQMIGAYPAVILCHLHGVMSQAEVSYESCWFQIGCGARSCILEEIGVLTCVTYDAPSPLISLYFRNCLVSMRFSEYCQRVPWFTNISVYHEVQMVRCYTSDLSA